MNNRVVILLVAITVIVTMVACLAVIVARSGGSLLAGRSEPTATPTKTPKPTFTATLTATPTPIPTDTPTPTPTPTFTLVPTDTPVPTDTETPTPEPSNTPVPTKKPTARPPAPTAKPTNKPAPTNPPAPQYAFRMVLQQNWPNCGSTGIKVYFKTRGGQPYPGMQFAVYAGGACVGLSSWANQMDGSTDFILSPDGARAGNWEVQAVETANGESGAAGCGAITKVASARIPAPTTASPCDTNSAGVQWVWLTLQEN